MSLRARLLIGLVVLAGLGVGASGLVTYEEQRSFMLGRLDEQVQSAIAPVSFSLGTRVRPTLGTPSPTAGSSRRPAGTSPARGGPVPGLATVTPQGTYGELVSSSGRVLARDVFHYGESAASAPALPRHYPVTKAGARVRPFTTSSRAGTGGYRVAAIAVGQGRAVIVAVPLGDVDQTLHRLIVVEGLVAAGVIVALMLLGWVVIRVGLRPLGRIGRVASEIASGDLSRRVAPATPRTEVGRLGIALNEMLIQIERAFADRQRGEERLRQFLADASHELRTPLSSIRGYAELVRIGAADDTAECKRVMGRVEAEATRMGGLVEDLLLLARLDELPEVRHDSVDLRRLAEHAVEDARAVAPERPITLTAPPGADVSVLGDADELRQVLANLLRNAIIHTPRATAIDVSVTREREHVLLDVRDHGPGLPGDAGDRVFDRFWRVEEGRSRASGGSGLGLAIVKAIVTAHHGEVCAVNDASGGARFSVALPAIG